MRGVTASELAQIPTVSVIDRRADLETVPRWLADGQTVAFGGSGLARKPLAAVRRLLDAGRRDLTVVTPVGGPEVELLLAAGAVRRLIASYVGLEGLGLAPTFRRLREAGALDFREWSEWTLILALRATVEGVPFAATRAALGSDTEADHPDWRRITCPFTGEPLLAVPALAPDLAL